MTRVRSFPPLIGRHPRIVVLGSMPGVASLEANQYYAHPRNAFWPIMGRLFAFDHRQDYAARVAALTRQPLILWDSLRACHRPGSLDARIDADSARANDFAGLLRRYPGISAFCFNGAAAERYFRRLALPRLPEAERFCLLRLPSTSPAHAGMRFDDKLAAWRRILEWID